VTGHFDDAQQIGGPTKAMQLKPSDEKAAPLPGRFLIKKVFPDILREVAEGASLQSALQSRSIAWRTFYTYLERSPTARESYAREAIQNRKMGG